MSLRNLKDQRRADLIIPYVPAAVKPEEGDIASTLANTLPMAAMFTRNKMIGWSAVIFAIQAWLNETPGQMATGKQPAYFGVGMSLVSLGITYMPLFMPGMNRVPGSGTAPAAPVEGAATAV